MDTCTDDVIFSLSLYLVPKELANLALVCKRFGYNNGTSKTKKKSSCQQNQDYPWSLMEEASRRRISAAKNDINNQYRNSDLITIRSEEESWMAVDQRLHQLQHSLVFSKLIGTSRYVNDDIRHVNVRKSNAGYALIAVCNKVMKSGNHSVEFHVTESEGGQVNFGIIDASIHEWPQKKMRQRELSSWCIALKRSYGDGRITKHGFIFIYVLVREMSSIWSYKLQ